MRISAKALRWLNIFFVVVIIVSLAKIFFSQSQPYVNTTAGLPRRLNVDGVSWTHEKTIVLFLQSACKYCHQSAPFHYELAQLAKSQGWGIVAIFPESVGIAQASLERVGLDIPAIESDLSLLGVSGTPTIAIVDDTGVVTSAWAGMLNDLKKRQVLGAMGVLPNAALIQDQSPKAKAFDFNTLSISSARSLLTNPSTLLLDIRSRESFRQSHLNGAINIPRDELEIRATHELDKSRKVVVFCQYLPECEKANQAAGLMTNCTIGTWYLKRTGYDVALLQSDMSMMTKNGYVVSR